MGETDKESQTLDQRNPRESAEMKVESLLEGGSADASAKQYIPTDKPLDSTLTTYEGDVEAASSTSSANVASPPLAMTSTKDRLRYYFGCRAELDVLEPLATTTGPRGMRVAVAYMEEGSSVYTDKELYSRAWKPKPPRSSKAQRQDADGRNPDIWSGLSGSVLSGGDFMLIRIDGVIEFDGRITIRASDRTLIDATYRGVVDLCEFAKDSADQTNGQSAYEHFSHGGYHFKDEYKNSSREVFVVPLTLSVAFETAGGPTVRTAGEDDRWIQKAILANERHFKRYRSLMRRQFVALGELSFRELTSGGRTVPNGIQANVFELVSHN